MLDVSAPSKQAPTKAKRFRKPFIVESSDSESECDTAKVPARGFHDLDIDPDDWTK